MVDFPWLSVKRNAEAETAQPEHKTKTWPSQNRSPRIVHIHSTHDPAKTLHPQKQSSMVVLHGLMAEEC